MSITHLESRLKQPLSTERPTRQLQAEHKIYRHKDFENQIKCIVDNLKGSPQLRKVTLDTIRCATPLLADHADHTKVGGRTKSSPDDKPLARPDIVMGMNFTTEFIDSIACFEGSQREAVEDIAKYCFENETLKIPYDTAKDIFKKKELSQSSLNLLKEFQPKASFYKITQILKGSSAFEKHSSQTQKRIVSILKDKRKHPKSYEKFQENPALFLRLNNTQLKQLQNLETSAADKFGAFYEQATNGTQEDSLPEAYKAIRSSVVTDKYENLTLRKAASHFFTGKMHLRGADTKMKQLKTKISERLDVSDKDMSDYLNKVKDSVAPLIDTAIEQEAKVACGTETNNALTEEWTKKNYPEKKIEKIKKKALYHNLEILESLYETSPQQAKQAFKMLKDINTDDILSGQNIGNDSLDYNRHSEESVKRIYDNMSDGSVTFPQFMAFPTLSAIALGATAAAIAMASQGTAVPAVLIAASAGSAGLLPPLLSTPVFSSLVSKHRNKRLSKEKMIKNMVEAISQKLTDEEKFVSNETNLSKEQKKSIKELGNDQEHIRNAAIEGNFSPKRIKVIKNLHEGNKDWFDNNKDTLLTLKNEKLNWLVKNMSPASEAPLSNFIQNNTESFCSMDMFSMEQTKTAFMMKKDVMSNFITDNPNIWFNMTPNKRFYTIKAFEADSENLHNTITGNPNDWASFDEAAMLAYTHAAQNFDGDDNQTVGRVDVELSVRHKFKMLKLQETELTTEQEDKYFKEFGTYLDKRIEDETEDPQEKLKIAKYFFEKSEHFDSPSTPDYSSLTLKSLFSRMLHTVERTDLEWEDGLDTSEKRKEILYANMTDKLYDCGTAYEGDYRNLEKHSCWHGAYNRIINAAFGAIATQESAPEEGQFTSKELPQIIGNIFSALDAPQKATLLDGVADDQRETLGENDLSVKDFLFKDVGGKTLLYHIKEQSKNLFSSFKTEEGSEKLDEYLNQEGLFEYMAKPLEILKPLPTPEEFKETFPSILDKTLKTLPSEKHKQIQDIIESKEECSVADIHNIIQFYLQNNMTEEFMPLTGKSGTYTQLLKDVDMDNMPFNLDLFKEAPSQEEYNEKSDDILTKACDKASQAEHFKRQRKIWENNDNYFLNILTPFIDAASKEVFPSLSTEVSHDTLEALRFGLKDKLKADKGAIIGFKAMTLSYMDSDGGAREQKSFSP